MCLDTVARIMWLEQYTTDARAQWTFGTGLGTPYVLVEGAGKGAGRAFGE
jgi:hypothetical protein